MIQCAITSVASPPAPFVVPQAEHVVFQLLDASAFLKTEVLSAVLGGRELDSVRPEDYGTLSSLGEPLGSEEVDSATVG